MNYSVLHYEVFFLGDSKRPLPKDEDAEEFKLMRAKPAPSIEELMNKRPYQQEPQRSTQQPSPAYNGRFQQPVLPSTETQQQTSPSQLQAMYVPPPPLPSQFRIPAL
jgi:hypothetical protein